jgi:hypothetical protein
VLPTLFPVTHKSHLRIAAGIVFNSMHGFAHGQALRLLHDIRVLHLGKAGWCGEQVERINATLNALAPRIAASSVETAKKLVAGLSRHVADKKLRQLPVSLQRAKKKADAEWSLVAMRLFDKCKTLEQLATTQAQEDDATTIRWVYVRDIVVLSVKHVSVALFTACVRSPCV